MLGSIRSKRTNVLVWLLLIMLIVGLAGFGIGVGGGLTSTNVATVGDQEIEADAYARALDQELRALSGQIGRGLTMDEARQFGIDRMVLGRLVNDAALDGEAARLGLSTGDEAVRAQVVATPAFQGLDGSFDREAYTFALDRIGLSPAEFESLLRREAARELVAGGVQAAAALPESAALTLLGHAGERRSFAWLRLDAAPPARAGAGADRGGAQGALRREPRPLHPPGDQADRLCQRHARGAGGRDRDPRGRAARRLRRGPRALRHPRAAHARPHRLRHRGGGGGGEGAARRAARSTSTRSPRSAGSPRRRSTKARWPPRGWRPRRATRSSAPTAPGSSGRCRPRSGLRSTG